MPENKISAREIQEQDIEPIINYWLNASDEFMTGMGVDLTKMPTREQWRNFLHEQLSQSYKEKKSYCIVWLLNDQPVGHSNISKIIFGKEAFMHLHLWNKDTRQKGLGTDLVKKTLPYYFNNMELQTLYCEPYALNPPPNKTLKRVGFDLVKAYTCIPGWLNFEQEVNLWEMKREKFEVYGV